METGSAYKKHTGLMDHFKISDGRKNYQAPNKENFESVYKKAVDGDVGFSNAKETEDESVKSFLKKLHELGAGRFLSELNREKIEKLVEKYKDQLMKNMDQTSMSIAEVEKLVSDFRKELLEKLQMLSKQEKSMKSEEYFKLKSLLA